MPLWTGQDLIGTREPGNTGDSHLAGLCYAIRSVVLIEVLETRSLGCGSGCRLGFWDNGVIYLFIFALLSWRPGWRLEACLNAPGCTKQNKKYLIYVGFQWGAFINDVPESTDIGRYSGPGVHRENRHGWIVPD